MVKVIDIKGNIYENPIMLNSSGTVLSTSKPSQEKGKWFYEN
jgi:hypothetical protein